MTQEDKELLLKDLCARLPYKVKCQWDTYYNGILSDVCKCKTYDGFVYWDCYFEEYGDDVPIEIVKPYLRPMSSMTEKEKEEWYKESYVDYDCEFQPTPTLALEHCHLSTDWLNEHHFDYRNLIEKGLALKAPEGMYN